MGRRLACLPLIQWFGSLAVEKNLHEVGMQRPPQIDLLPALCAARDDSQVPSYRLPPVVWHVPRFLVAYPRMGASSPRVYP